MLNDIIGSNPYTKLIPETVDNNIIRFSSPKAIHHAYNLNLVHGCFSRTKHDKMPEYVRKFAQYNYDALKANQADNQSIIFEDTTYYSKIKGAGKGIRVDNGKSYLQLDPVKSGKGNQATGDCVSWAIRDAIDQLRANRIVDGRLEAYIERQSTAGIYSGRGHTGQGADSISLSAWAIKIGVLLEKVYETKIKKYDFTKYQDYVQWGISRGRVGMPDDLLELTKPYTTGTYKVIASTDGLADLLATKGTAHCGSMLSVSSQGNPISQRTREGWAHDMNIYMYDDTAMANSKFGGRIWGWQNSWGGWNTVNNIPDEWKPYPEGAFWINDKDTQYALDDGGTAVFFDGSFFNAEPLDNKII